MFCSPKIRFFAFMLQMHVIASACLAESNTEEAAETFLLQMLAKQQENKSVQAQIKQIKRLPTLSQPLEVSGAMSLIPGKALRWEVGAPPRHILIYYGGNTTFLDQRARTAEQLVPTDRRARMLRMILGVGPDSGLNYLKDKFRIKSIDRRKGYATVVFEPEAPMMKAVLRRIVVNFDLETGWMESVEWEQVDDSTTRLEFETPRLNEQLSPSLFTFDRRAYKKEEKRNHKR